MEKIIEILSDIRPDVDFAGNDKLIDDGILDSFDVVSIVAELSDAFDIDIEADDIVPENFNSVQAISKMIDRLSE